MYNPLSSDSGVSVNWRNGKKSMIPWRKQILFNHNCLHRVARVTPCFKRLHSQALVYSVNLVGESKIVAIVVGRHSSPFLFFISLSYLLCFATAFLAFTISTSRKMWSVCVCECWLGFFALRRKAINRKIATNRDHCVKSETETTGHSRMANATRKISFIQNISTLCVHSRLWVRS